MPTCSAVTSTSSPTSAAPGTPLEHAIGDADVAAAIEHDICGVPGPLRAVHRRLRHWPRGSTNSASRHPTAHVIGAAQVERKRPRSRSPLTGTRCSFTVIAEAMTSSTKVLPPTVTAPTRCRPAPRRATASGGYATLTNGRPHLRGHGSWRLLAKAGQPNTQLGPQCGRTHAAYPRKPLTFCLQIADINRPFLTTATMLGKIKRVDSVCTDRLAKCPSCGEPLTFVRTTVPQVSDPSEVQTFECGPCGLSLTAQAVLDQILSGA
jgi:hypothetical protein